MITKVGLNHTLNTEFVAGIAMNYYRDPGNEVVMLQTDSGRLLARRNLK